MTPNETLKLASTHFQSGKMQEAEALYTQVLQIAPNHPEILYQLGVIAYQRGNLDKAVRYFEQALQCKPNFPEVHFNLGNLKQQLGNKQEALTHFQKAVALNPSFADAHNNLGILLYGFGAVDEAISHYQQALRHKPHSVEIHNNLGSSLRSKGKRDQALFHFQKALALDPTSAEVFNNLSEFLTVASPEVQQMETLLQSERPENQQARLHFALAKIFDKGKEYNKAFAHAQKANDLKRKSFTYRAKDHQTIFQEIRNIFTKEYFEMQRRKCGNLSHLPILIVGMPRSGTTLVEQIIASHPQAFGGGEMNQFRRMLRPILQASPRSSEIQVLAGLDEASIDHLAQTYLNHLKTLAPQAERITDKMPDNFFTLGLWIRCFPNIKIIHCQRDPLDTCLSCYFTYFQNGQGFTYDLKELGMFYHGYETLMEHWQEVLPVEILNVQYETLVENQETVSRRILEFCGLDWDPQCLMFHKHERTIQTASHFQVRRPMYRNSIGRWKPYAAHLTSLRKVLQR